MQHGVNRNVKIVVNRNVKWNRKIEFEVEEQVKGKLKCIFSKLLLLSKNK